MLQRIWLAITFALFTVSAANAQTNTKGIEFNNQSASPCGVTMSCLYTKSTGGVFLTTAADGASANALIIDTSTGWVNAAARLLSIKNNNVDQVYVKADGTVIMAVGSGQRLCAPAGGNCFQFYDSVLLVEGVGIRPSSSGEINGSAGTQAWGETGARIYSTDVPTTKAISSNTIAPTHYITHVGAGLLKTITPPTFGFNGVLVLWPDAAFTYDATGNILVAAGSAATAVVDKPMIAVYDANISKWSMSY